MLAPSLLTLSARCEANTSVRSITIDFKHHSTGSTPQRTCHAFHQYTIHNGLCGNVNLLRVLHWTVEGTAVQPTWTYHS
eukprot:5504313-Amphidinium_carterae.1